MMQEAATISGTRRVKEALIHDCARINSDIPCCCPASAAPLACSANNLNQKNLRRYKSGYLSLGTMEWNAPERETSTNNNQALTRTSRDHTPISRSQKGGFSCG